jgi:drug/metabolite transporter (DMT)-like permease
MGLGLLAALVSAVCYGVATVLQASAARATATARWGLLRMLTRTAFVAGILLDVAGFVAQFVALRVAPVFLVQAAQAGNLAVTALVAVPVLKIRLTSGEWIAVAGVCAGLAGLGLSAVHEGAARTPPAFHVALLIAAIALTGVGLLAVRRRGTAGSAVLGVVAGLQFGIPALAIRTLESLSPAHLVRDPAAYALVLGGVAGFLCFAAGLQRGRVTVVTAATVIGETLAPAVVGILVLGDHTRAGYPPLAVAGFVATLVGAAALARFGDVEPREPVPAASH